MLRSRVSLLLLFAPLAVVWPAGAEETSAPAGSVAGVVSHDLAPLERATVYAYEVARATTTRVLTGEEGGFRFAALPAGVYKLVAYKVGFAPAVALLSRASADAQQFVELRLAAEERVETRSGEAYWELREQIPSDVLREIHAVAMADWATPGVEGRLPRFSGTVRAATGVDDTGALGDAHLTGAGIGMEGRIGDLRLGVDGEFWRLAGATAHTGIPAGDGQATSLQVRMAGTGEGELGLTTISQRLRRDEGVEPVDFERYRLRWSQPLGARGRSQFSAQYTTQSNFHLQSVAAPAIPAVSSNLRLEGSYSVDLSDRAALETGIRFHERNGQLGFDGDPGAPSQAVDVYGRGGWRAMPSVVVEYGLFTQLLDGSLALAPQGSVVVQLGQRWQAVGTASQRVTDDIPPERRAFATLQYAASSRECQDLDRSCYRLVLSREDGDDELFALAAIHREVAETLQLYFSQEFFHQLESVYLVPGDEVPEVQLVVQRRLTPRVLARLESTFAEGGGGLLYATDQGSGFANEVRYLVTSLDTQLQATSTGVFLAFHQLEQDLDPFQKSAAGEPALSLERLQLMLSQDLNVLLQLASDWAVHLNFELSRGASPWTLEGESPDDLRKRFTGGFSVRF